VHKTQLRGYEIVIDGTSASNLDFRSIHYLAHFCVLLSILLLNHSFFPLLSRLPAHTKRRKAGYIFIHFHLEETVTEGNGRGAGTGA